MSDIPCPSCGGSKQLQIVHVKYAPGYKGPPVTEMPCIVCDGAGTITAVREQRMERGGKFHKYRVDFLQLGLRKAAELWGINAVQLSYIEQGRVETDWVPPGFLDWVGTAEPKTTEPQ